MLWLVHVSLSYLTSQSIVHFWEWSCSVLAFDALCTHYYVTDTKLNCIPHAMLAQRLLFLILSVILPCIVIAQDEAKSGTTCSFSCPATDKLSQPLVKLPYAVGFESFYSIFECMWVINGRMVHSQPVAHLVRYQSSDSNLPGHIHTCSYYKVCMRPSLPCFSSPFCIYFFFVFF